MESESEESSQENNMESCCSHAVNAGFSVVRTIFISKEAIWNLWINNETVKPMTSDYSFDLLPPREKIAIVEFDSYSMRKGDWNCILIQRRSHG